MNWKAHYRAEFYCSSGHSKAAFKTAHQSKSISLQDLVTGVTQVNVFHRAAPDLNVTLSWLLLGCRPELCWPSHLAPETEVTEETQEDQDSNIVTAAPRAARS